MLWIATLYQTVTLERLLSFHGFCFPLLNVPCDGQGCRLMSPRGRIFVKQPVGPPHLPPPADAWPSWATLSSQGPASSQAWRAAGGWALSASFTAAERSQLPFLACRPECPSPAQAHMS